MGKAHNEKLKAMLNEDAPEEADELIGVLEKLQQWQAPEPDRQNTARLLQNLIPALPAPERKWQDWWPLLLLKAQMRVVRREIWAASFLVMSFGILVTISTQGAFNTPATLPLALVAPIINAVGVAFLYESEDETLEVELATPVSPRLLLLARLVLLFAFNLVIGLGGSFFVAAFVPGLSLWPLVLSWLVPMTFLSALAFLLSVLFSDPLVGVFASLLLWTVQITGRFSELNGLSLSLPDLAAPEARPWLLVLTLLLGAAAFYLSGREERWLSRR